jgi:hypothetical protein
MATESDGQREARERGWDGAAGVEFAKHWDAGGQEAVRQNRAAIAAARHSKPAGEIAAQRPGLAASDVYERRRAAVRAARGEPIPDATLSNVVADPSAVYARRAPKDVP